MSMIERLKRVGIDPTKEVALLRKVYVDSADKKGKWTNAELGFLCTTASALTSANPDVEQVDSDNDIIVLCGGEWSVSLAIVRTKTYKSMQPISKGYKFRDLLTEVIVSQDESYIETAAGACVALAGY